MRTIICALALSALAAAPVLADETVMTGPEITKFLSDTTVRGNQDGEVWTQNFTADGGTTYTTAKYGETTGTWEVRGDAFCSNWPPSESWDCYRITGEGDNVSFVPDDGSKAWPATRQ